MAALRHLIILSLGLLSIWHAAPASARADLPPIRIVTSNYAPFNYIENDTPKGLCTEIVFELLKELKIKAPLETLPWARAYQTVLKRKNTMIYTIARTPDREHLFHWIGALVTGDSYLFSLKDRTIRLNALRDALPYRIGASRNDIRANFLVENGILGLDLVVDSRMNAVKLLNQRIDLWAEDELAAVHTVRKLGYDPDRTLHRTLSLDLIPKPVGYLAFSRDTDERVIEAFKRAYKAFAGTAAFQAIKNRYRHPGPPPE